MKKYKALAINIILLIIFAYCNPLINSFTGTQSIAYTDGDSIPESYDLRNDISITVKNQYHNAICYMVATSSMWETHIKLRKTLYNDYDFYNKTPIFSMLTDKRQNGFRYSPTSIDDTEKLLKNYYNDQTYTEDKLLKNTTGYQKSVVEQDVKAKIASITQELQTNATSDGNGLRLDEIQKSISSSGEIIYKDGKGNILDEKGIKSIRDEFKKFILKNGGLKSSISTKGFCDANISDEGIYEGTVTSGQKVCYYNGDEGSNHVVLIIGWDDNFSKENFPEDNRPKTDGAYLALNSWGKEWGDNGTFYISYEDLRCEELLFGIEEAYVYEDNLDPKVDFTVNNEKIKIKCSDSYGTGVNEKSLKYMWTNHNIKPNVNDENWKTFTNEEELAYEENKYLWVIAEDKAGNKILTNNRHNSNDLYIDGVRPKDDPVWTNSVTVNLFQGDLEEFELNVWSDTISDEELKKMLTVDTSGGYGYVLNIDKEGVHTINVAPINKKDGYEDLGVSFKIKIDKTAPTKPNINISGTGNGNEYQKGATVTVESGIDNVSGVSRTEVAILDENGANVEVDNESQFKLDKLGQYTIKAITYDQAGNKSDETSLTVKIVENILVKNIQLSPKDLTLNNAVKSAKLIATVEPENATNKDLKWKSNNEKVATVDQNGVVTAVANGTAQITAETTDGSGISATITCKVIEHTNPTGIEIQGKDIARKDEKYTYTVKYTPEDANINKDVKWTVSDEKIATINSDTGELEGKKAGKVTITATLKKIENVIATKEIEVYYENPTTAEPSATVTTNSIEVENKQSNKYAKIVKVEYGISENGEDWSWQETNKFEGLTDHKEYEVKTRATDENGAMAESEILKVKTDKLELGTLLLKKNESDEYEEGTWTNSSVTYELVDEKNLTTVKILNENNEVVDIQNNEIKDSGVYTILVEVTDGTNMKSREYTVKIDKVTVNIIVNKDSEEAVELVKLKINLENSISGVKSLKVNGVEIEYNNEGIIYEVTENGTYKFEVEDNAGNITEKSIEVSNIKKKDTNEPNNGEETQDNQSNNKNTSNNILPQTGEGFIICIVISIGIIVYAIKTYIKLKKTY